MAVIKSVAASKFNENATEKSVLNAVIADIGVLFTYLAGFLRGSATYDTASLNDGAGATTTITVTGAALGDYVAVSLGVDLQGITVTAYVSATDTVAIRIQNESGGTLDLASTTISVLVFKKSVWGTAIVAQTATV